MSMLCQVYTTNTAEAVQYQLRHSQANIAVVDSRAQLQKVGRWHLLMCRLDRCSRCGTSCRS